MGWLNLIMKKKKKKEDCKLVNCELCFDTGKRHLGFGKVIWCKCKAGKKACLIAWEN